MNKAVCENCAFFFSLGNEEFGNECRIKSPIISRISEYEDLRRSFPMVSKKDWCGEIKPKQGMTYSELYDGGIG
jgi:hypothetical protein